MKKEHIVSSLIILPSDDEASIARKRATLIEALRDTPPNERGEPEALRRAYELARISGSTEEEGRLYRAINRTLELQKLQLGSFSRGATP